MGDKSKIEWTDATWNPIRGCSRVSEGCRHCYAERIAARFSGPGQPYEGLAVMDGSGEPRWTGEIRLVEEHLLDPLRWRRRRRIFVNSMSDLFHEEAPFEWIDRIFAVMALSPQHTFQVLTKRPQRMKDWFDARPRRSYCRCMACGRPFDRNATRKALTCICPFCDAEDREIAASREWPLPNVWLGVSVENQETAEERIPILLQTPAAVRWISYEPALGPVVLRDGWLRGRPHHACQAGHCIPARGRLDWVVAGGESGPGARPAHPDWFRTVRNHCYMAGVPLFFKQWGEYLPWDQQRERNSFMSPAERAAGSDRLGKKSAGHLLDGREWNEFPERTA